MPPFYIGSTSIEKILNGYHGSVVSNEFRQIWKSELSDNPHLFCTIVLSVHDTRENAFDTESKLQVELDSTNSTLFINKAVASKNFFFTSNHTPESRIKISNALKNRSLSLNHRQKISSALTNKEKTIDHCLSLVAAWKDRDRKMTSEQKTKISLALTGKSRTQQAKINISKSKKGIKQKQITCPHCNKTGGISAMKVYHFDRCKILSN